MTRQHVDKAGQIYRVAVDASSSGNNTLVAAVSGCKIIVLSFLAVAPTAVTVTFKSASTALSGPMPPGANGGFVMPHNPVGWMKGGTNEALILNLDSAVRVGGVLVYQLVPTGTP